MGVIGSGGVNLYVNIYKWPPFFKVFICTNVYFMNFEIQP